jgi:hypothetical protein
MVLHFVLTAVFFAGLAALIISVIRIARSAKNMTPRQVIRMFEKLQEKRGTK